MRVCQCCGVEINSNKKRTDLEFCNDCKKRIIVCQLISSIGRDLHINCYFLDVPRVGEVIIVTHGEFTIHYRIDIVYRFAEKIKTVYLEVTEIRKYTFDSSEKPKAKD